MWQDLLTLWPIDFTRRSKSIHEWRMKSASRTSAAVILCCNQVGQSVVCFPNALLTGRSTQRVCTFIAPQCSLYTIKNAYSYIWNEMRTPQATSLTFLKAMNTVTICSYMVNNLRNSLASSTRFRQQALRGRLKHMRVKIDTTCTHIPPLHTTRLNLITLPLQNPLIPSCFTML